ncbi:hypothetical protein [Polaromonas sp. CG9_12]|nr:hypothetical protein [Polaromonas sp. CG9_12]
MLYGVHCKCADRIRHHFVFGHQALAPEVSIVKVIRHFNGRCADRPLAPLSAAPQQRRQQMP